jgi:hypothetical protein
MLKSRVHKLVCGVALSAGLAGAGTASAAIDFGPSGDDLLNGAFNQMRFGVAGSMNVLPLLYVGDLGDTGPARSFLLGTDLSFDYQVAGIGTSVVTVTYQVTNDEFSSGPFTDLRLMVSTRTKGEPGALDTAEAIGFGGAAAAGDPAQFRIFDFDAPGDPPSSQIINADALNGTNACGAGGCYPEMALQWNLPSIAPGETWTVSFLLVDDPALVVGGRYVQSTSLGSSGQQLVFGNPLLVPEPGTYVLMLAGLGTLLLAARRSRSAA